jgi:hypothetical protein
MKPEPLVPLEPHGIPRTDSPRSAQ